MEITITWEGLLAVGAVGGAILPSSGALVMYFLQDWRKRDLARYVKTYPEKVEFAREVLRIFNETLVKISEKIDGNKLQKSLKKDLLKFRSRAILFASPKTLKLWLDIIDEKNLSKDKWQKLDSFGRLFFSLREDVGLSNKGLTSEQLLKIIIKSSEWEELEKNLGRWKIFRRWRN